MKDPFSDPIIVILVLVISAWAIGGLVFVYVAIRWLNWLDAPDEDDRRLDQ